MGTFRELVEMVLVGFLQEEPEKAEGLDPALVERVRTGEATLTDLDLLAASLHVSRMQLVSLLHHLEQLHATSGRRFALKPRIDHHLNHWLLAATKTGLPAKLVVRDLAVHLAEVCPRCAVVWQNQREEADDGLAAIRRDLDAPEEEAPEAATAARRLLGHLLESPPEERQQEIDFWPDEELSRHLVEVIRRAAWATDDGEEGLSLAEAAREVLHRRVAPDPELPVQEVDAALYVGYLVANARAHRLRGDVEAASGALDNARTQLLDHGVQDIRTLTELDTEFGRVLWAWLRHSEARLLLERCLFVWLRLGEDRMAVETAVLATEVCLDEGNVRRAAEALETLSEFEDLPFLPPWLLVLLRSQVLAMQGRVKQARSLLQEGPLTAKADATGLSVLGRDPLRVRVLHQRGVLDLRLNRPADAKESLLGGWSLAGEIHKPLLAARCAVGLAKAAVLEKKPHEARRWLREARQLNGLPENAAVALELFEDGLEVGAAPRQRFAELDRYLDRLDRNPLLSWEEPS